MSNHYKSFKKINARIFMMIVSGVLLVAIAVVVVAGRSRNSQIYAVGEEGATDKLQADKNSTSNGIEKDNGLSEVSVDVSPSPRATPETTVTQTPVSKPAKQYSKPAARVTVKPAKRSTPTPKATPEPTAKPNEEVSSTVKPTSTPAPIITPSTEPVATATPEASLEPEVSTTPTPEATEAPESSTTP